MAETDRNTSKRNFRQREKVTHDSFSRPYRRGFFSVS